MAQVGKKYTKWILFFVLLIVAAFIIFPILVVLMNSVKGNLFISSTGAFKLPNEQSFVGASNYINGIEKISFFSAFGYSLWITIASVAFILLLTSMLAWYITRVKGKVTSTIYYLLVFSTNAFNTGSVFDSDALRVWLDAGNTPQIIETATLDLNFADGRAGVPEVWALNFDGTRAEKITAVSRRGGKFALQLDTSKLRFGTVFFEIVYR